MVRIGAGSHVVNKRDQKKGKEQLEKAKQQKIEVDAKLRQHEIRRKEDRMMKEASAAALEKYAQMNANDPSSNLALRRDSPLEPSGNFLEIKPQNNGSNSYRESMKEYSEMNDKSQFSQRDSQREI